MTYALNHPFSPNYVSQIPVTESDRKSAAARRYILRMEQEGKENASKQMFGAINSAEVPVRKRGCCPLCSTHLEREKRPRRVVNGVSLLVCPPCAVKLTEARKEAA